MPSLCTAPAGSEEREQLRGRLQVVPAVTEWPLQFAAASRWSLPSQTGRGTRSSVHSRKRNRKDRMKIKPLSEFSAIVRKASGGPGIIRQSWTVIPCRSGLTRRRRGSMRTTRPKSTSLSSSVVDEDDGHRQSRVRGRVQSR